MRASVRPCLEHGTGIAICVSVRPCLRHGISTDCKTMSGTWHRHRCMGASVRPCPGHGISILPFCIRLIRVTKLARVGDRWRFHHTIQLLKGINDFKY
ncbi:Dihydrodipicolinate reductase [Gossypium arboreum]|uniref:Dihydrodipicolinate reductase n=1 Tax=Gossypium arboreum TaxID=29729 RepID=A0A0B0MV34_GOSAR|nr:Dihydrodipicolinate reductase [Gossypium arboreum]